MCVATYSLLGRLPSDGRCSCEPPSTGAASAAAARVRHNTHRQTKAALQVMGNLSDAEVDLMRRATRDDEIVWRAAQERFHVDVRRVEAETGARILCV